MTMPAADVTFLRVTIQIGNSAGEVETLIENPITVNDVPVALAWRCRTCQDLSFYTCRLPFYECPDCEETHASESGRCPDCGRPMILLGPDTCIECEDGLVDPTRAFRCPFCKDVVEMTEDAAVTDHFVDGCR